MPHQNTEWQPSASLRSGVVSSIAVLDTVDSTNTPLAHALGTCLYSDARQRVEKPFGDDTSTTDAGTAKGFVVPGTRGKAEDTPRKDAREGIATAERYEGRAASRGTRRWPGTGPCNPPPSVVVDVQVRCRGRLDRDWVKQAG